MTYFVYIETAAATVSHMEPVDALNADHAIQEALRLLHNHQSGVSAVVYNGDAKVAVVAREEVER